MSASVDLATELSGDYHDNAQTPASPASPLRPASVSGSGTGGQMTLPSAATSNYYSPPRPSLLHHHAHQAHQHDVPGAVTKAVKLTAHAASGNGLGASTLQPVKSSDHITIRSSDQVMTDQAREILRQAVVSSGLSGENHGGAKGGIVTKSSKAQQGVVVVRYRECQKNHAASIGGHAIDGCGEFMPDNSGGGGGDDDEDALRCAACSCHRNFHRREVEGDAACDCKALIRRPKATYGSPLHAHPGPLALAAAPSNQIGPLAMAAAMSTGGPTDSDDGDDVDVILPPARHDHHMGSGALHLSMAHRSPASAIKKRFRTKFTTEQKDQMCAFADKLGWRIQKHDEAAVQEFCSTVGVKRHVLKVWMHNNKHTMGKAPKPA